MELEKNNDGWVEVRSSDIKPILWQQAIPVNCERLSIVSLDFFSAELAKTLNCLQSLREIRIWCDAGRTSIPHLLKLPNLEKIELCCLRSPGRKLRGFEDALKLKEFGCSYYLTPSDLYAISQSNSIEELNAQGSIVDTKAIECLLQMSSLMRLNLEDTELDDAMVSILASSSTIKGLDVGASKVTEIGFKKICQMTQLESLDAWALKISESNLDELATLTNLKYLSIGGYDDQDTLTAAGVISRLDNIPSLKRIWLDGIAVSESQSEYLNEKYDNVSLT